MIAIVVALVVAGLLVAALVVVVYRRRKAGQVASTSAAETAMKPTRQSYSHDAADFVQDQSENETTTDHFATAIAAFQPFETENPLHQLQSDAAYLEPFRDAAYVPGGYSDPAYALADSRSRLPSKYVPPCGYSVPFEQSGQVESSYALATLSDRPAGYSVPMKDSELTRARDVHYDIAGTGVASQAGRDLLIERNATRLDSVVDHEYFEATFAPAQRGMYALPPNARFKHYSTAASTSSAEYAIASGGHNAPLYETRLGEHAYEQPDSRAAASYYAAAPHSKSEYAIADSGTDTPVVESISRTEAESRVAGQPEGCFVLRTSSSDPQSIVITATTHSGTVHVAIRVANGQYVLPDQTEFASLAALLSWYRSTEMPVRTPIRLGFACTNRGSQSCSLGRRRTYLGWGASSI